jgi:heme oxygenase
MPIHKKLDSIGIAVSMKNETFNQNEYGKWAQLTLKFLTTVYNIIQSDKLAADNLLQFLPKSMGIDLLKDDLRAMGYNTEPTSISEVLYPSEKDHYIVVVYTFLGSLMGTEMIYEYISNKIPNLPTKYLEYIIEHKSQWKPFLDYLNKYQLTIDPDNLSQYTKDFWNIIYQDHQNAYSQ